MKYSESITRAGPKRIYPAAALFRAATRALGPAAKKSERFDLFIRARCTVFLPVPELERPRAGYFRNLAGRVLRKQDHRYYNATKLEDPPRKFRKPLVAFEPNETALFARIASVPRRGIIGALIDACLA